MYFYHLKFELYDTPHPDKAETTTNSTIPNPNLHHRQIYLPPPGTDIFSSDLPAHAHPAAEDWWTSGTPRTRTTNAVATSPTPHGYPHTLSEPDIPVAHSTTSLNNGVVDKRVLPEEQQQTKKEVIDCGSARRPNLHRSSSESDFDFPPPSASIHLGPRQAVRDWRFGKVAVESIDSVVPPQAQSHQNLHITSTTSRLGTLQNGSLADTNMEKMGGQEDTGTNGTSYPIRTSKTSTTVAMSGDSGIAINSGPRTRATKARFEPLTTNGEGTGENRKITDLGWGVVHLYRDGEETLDFATTQPVHAESSADGSTGDSADEAQELPVDCTTLCIPAVPSYMTPSDFLGFVGEKTREEVSHFRMVMTGRMNRYLVLMKFRDAGVARRWKAEWDGKVFNGVEPENCHVMFIKSIIFQTPTGPSSIPDATSTSFPSITHDPFITPASTATISLKPLPPPTPNLVELPTCPVCLERMDDTTGLLTILCQHVFHCACLQKWRGSGCPVCRHTQSPTPLLPAANSDTLTPFGPNPGGESLCTVCDCVDDLWICLICGNIGCGRYKGGHAKRHWRETGHPFSLEIETQHVWDYAGDMWVHRLIQNKGDGKLVDLPVRNGASERRGERDSSEELVPREKLDGIGMEYTHLLTSQLESQRVYFDGIVKKAVDKASAATSAAEEANKKAEEALRELAVLKKENEGLKEGVRDLEKERDRAVQRAEKTREVAMGMTKRWQEEKGVGEGLMKRIEHINKSMMEMSKELTRVKEENEELKEQNRDLGFFISGQQKLKELEGQGEGQGQVTKEELEGGTVVVPEKKRGRGKGKK